MRGGAGSAKWVEGWVKEGRQVPFFRSCLAQYDIVNENSSCYSPELDGVPFPEASGMCHEHFNRSGISERQTWLL